MKLPRTWTIPLLTWLAISLIALGAFTACSSDDGDNDEATAAAASSTAASRDADAAEIEQTIRAGIAAWNGKDATAFLALFTDNGVSDIFGEGEPATREEIAAGLPNFIGDPPLELRELTTEADGATGAAEVLWVSDPFLEHIRLPMVKADGAWKIDGQDYIDVDDVPDGTTMVNVETNEFAFGVVDDDISSANARGPIGFDINNVGQQPHQLGLAKLPAEGDVLALLMSEEDVPGLDFAGFTDAIEPGERNRAFVLVEPLEPGRYALICFLPDTAEGPDGTPHAIKGMVREFTIP